MILSSSNATGPILGSIQLRRPDGRLIATGADAVVSVSLIDLIQERIRSVGSQQKRPEYLYEAPDFVAQGKVKTIAETYPLAEAAKACERVAEGEAGSAPPQPGNRTDASPHAPSRSFSCSCLSSGS